MPAKKSRVVKSNTSGLTWFTNVGKSLGLSTMDIISEMMPATMDTIDSNKDMAINVYNSIKSLKGKNKKNIEGMLTGAAEKNYATLKTAITNAREDLKTGNLYNKQRLLDSFNDGLDMDFDFDFSDDLSDDNFSDSDSDNADVKVVVPEVNITSNINKNNPMVKAVQTQSDIILETSEAAAKRDISIATTQMSLSKKLGDNLYRGMETINENLSLLVNFHSTNMTKYIGASLRYYEDQLRITNETLELYKKSLEPPKVETRSSNDPMDSVFGVDGGLNIGGYAELVKKQINDTLDSNIFTSSIKMMFSDTDALSSMAQQPLKFIADGIVKTFIPSFLKESLAAFDDTLKNFVPSMLMKINSLRDSDNPFLSALGSIFGIDIENKKKIDTSKYERGSVPFDGLTRKSIVEVIPGYLSKILNAITKTGDIAYNYESGKFERVDDIRKNYKSTVDRKVIGEYSGYTDLIDKLQAFDFADREGRDDYIKRIDEMLIKMTDTDKIYNPDKLDDLAEISGMSGKELALLAASISKLSKQQRLRMFGAEDRWKARKARTEYMYSLESDPGSIGAVMFNDLYSDKLYKSPTTRGSVYVTPDTVSDERRRANAAKGVSTFGSIDDLPDDPREIASMIQAHEDAENSGANSSQKSRWINAGKFLPEKAQGKYNSVHDVINKIVTAPATVVRRFFNKINDSMYELVFGKTELDDHEGSGSPISFFGAILDKITTGFGNFFKYLKNEIYEPIHEAIFGKEGMITKFKQSDMWKGIKEKTNKFSDYLFGTKGEGGFRQGGLFSDTANEMGDIFRGFKYYFTGSAYTNSKGEKFADNKDSVFGNVKSLFTGFKNTLKEYLFGSSGEKKDKVKGVFSEALNTIKQGFQNFADAMFGPKRFGDKDNKNYVDINKIMAKIKERSPKAIAHSMIGGGVGLLGSMGSLGVLGSMVLDPFSGAVIGLSTSFLSQSDTFKNWLFGEKDPKTNERIGGFINKSTQEFFRKNKTGIVGGATVGALKGILGIGILPSYILGGPLSGAIWGMATSMLFKSDKFQNWLFGEKQQDGSRTNGFLNKLMSRTTDAETKKRLGNIGAGALAGLGLGYLTSNFGVLGALSIGPIGGALAGAAAGIALSSDKWKKYLFGEFDEKTGDKKGGLLNKFMNFISVEALQPLKVQITEWKFNIMNWFEDKIAAPFLDSIDPLREEFNRLKQSISNLFHNMWVSFKESPLIKETKKYLIDPIIGGFKKYLFDPLRASASFLIDKTGKILGSVLSTPLKALSYIADKLVVKHMQQGLQSVRAKIIDNIKNSDFALGVKKYLVSPIEMGIDWIKDKTTQFFDGTKKILKETLGWGFNMLWKGTKALLSSPFKLASMPFKAVSRISNYIKGKRGRDVKDQDLQDDIWSGRGGSFIRSVGDLVQTYNPFSKIRHDAKFGEIDREKVKQSVADRFRRQHKKDGAILTDEELERLTDEEMRKYQSGAFYESDRQKKIRERAEARKARKQQRADTLAAMKEQLNFNKELATIYGYDTHTPDGISLKYIYKDIDKQLEDQYGKDWKSKSKFERDEFKLKQIELSTTKDIKTNTAATVERLDILNDVMQKVADDLHVPVDSSETGTAIEPSNKKSRRLRARRKKDTNVTVSDNVDNISADIVTGLDNSSDTTVPTTSKKRKGVFSKIKGASKKAGGFMRDFTSTLSSAFSKSLADEDARDDKEEEIKSENMQDEQELEEKHDFTTRKDYSFMKEQQSEDHEKNEERSFRSQVLEKLGIAAGAIKQQTEGFFDIFGKETGLLIIALLPVLKYITKFFKDPDATLGSFALHVAGKIGEFFGFTDTDGDRTNSTGGIQTNNNAIETAVTGSIQMGAKAVQKGAKVASKFSKIISKVKKFFSPTDPLKESADKIYKETYSKAMSEFYEKAAKEGGEGTVSEAAEKLAKEASEKVYAEATESLVKKGVSETVEKASKKVASKAIGAADDKIITNFLKLAEPALANLKKSAINFLKKAGKKVLGNTIDDVFKPVIAKLSKTALGKYVTKIATKMGVYTVKEAGSDALNFGGWTALINVGIDAAFMIYGGATGATKSETANLFRVNQSDVTAGMMTVSGFFKAILNAPYIWIIDLINEIITAMSGYDFMSELAVVMYGVFVDGDAEAALKDARANFTADYQTYNEIQGILDPSKVNSPESLDSYNDRVNKSIIGKFFGGIADVGHWGEDLILGNGGGDYAKQQEALSQKSKLDQMLKYNPELADNTAFKESYKQVEKQIKDTNKKVGLKDLLDKFYFGETEYATDADGNMIIGADGNPVVKTDQFGSEIRKGGIFGKYRDQLAPFAGTLSSVPYMINRIKYLWKDNILYQTNEKGEAILDENGNPIPVVADPNMSPEEIEQKYGKGVFYDPETGHIVNGGAKRGLSTIINKIKTTDYKALASSAWDKTKTGLKKTGHALSNNVFDDARIRSELGLNEDTDILLKDRISMGMATTVSHLTGGKVDTSEAIKKIHGVFSLVETTWDNIKESISTTWKNVKENVKTGINIANDKIGASLGMVDDNGNPLSLTEGVKYNYTKIKTDLIEGWSELKSFVSEKWLEWKTAISEDWAEFKKNIKTGLKIGDEKLGALLGLEDDNGKPLSLTAGVKYNYTKIKTDLITGWTKLKTTASDLWTVAQDEFAEWKKGFKQKLKDALNVIDEKLGALFGFVNEKDEPLSLTEGISYNWDKTKEKLSEGWEGLKDNVSDAWEGIKSWFANIGKSLTSASESDVKSRNNSGGGIGGSNGFSPEGPMVPLQYASRNDNKHYNQYKLYGDKYSHSLTPVKGRLGVFETDDGQRYGIGGSAMDLFSKYSITSNFGWRDLDKDGKKENMHKGIDLVLGKDAPIKSFTDGKVIAINSSAKANSGYLGNKDGGGFGNYVKLQTDDGKYTTYAHLNSVGVKVGDTVQQGDVLGKQGHTGNSTGSHLHFQVNTDGGSSSYTEPTAYLRTYKSNGSVSSSISGTNTTQSTGLNGVIDVLSDYLSPVSDAMNNITDIYSSILSPILGTTTSTTTTGSVSSGSSKLADMDIVSELPKLSVAQIREIIAKKFPSDSVVKVSDAEGIYNAQQKTGMSALAILGIGALESGWGTSQIAKNKGNLWGWNATNSNPYGNASSYSSTVGTAALEYAQDYMNTYYHSRGSKSIYSTGTGNNPSGKGYAYRDDGTIDSSWALKVGSIMETIYEIAKNVGGGIGGEYNFTNKSSSLKNIPSIIKSNRDIFKTVNGYRNVSQKNTTNVIESEKTSVPDGFWDKVIQVLSVIAENTGGTTDNIKSLVDKVNSSKTTNVVSSNKTVNNNESTNPMYKIANDRRHEITNKNYKTAKLIAQGIN